MSRGVVLLVAGVVVMLGAGALLIVDVEPASPDPAPFDDTVTVGLTLDEELRLGEDISLPRAQVFYSQYEYVVGYYGVETFIHDQTQEGHDQRVGYPLDIYVTDFTDTGVELDADGYPTTETEPSWIDGTDAWYVVGSDARSPAGETVVPFADRESASAFAADYGGDVLDWESLIETSFDADDAIDVRDRVDDHHREADALVDNRTVADDRPVSVVVGEDVETVQEGIDAAPVNTTVLVPDGVYDERLEIDRPISLAGENEPTIRGDANGSVVTITEPGVSVEGVSVEGVGELATGAESVPGDPIPDDQNEQFLTHYTGGDAAISAHVADGTTIEDVRIETPSNGVILRDSPDSVVRNVTIQGNERSGEGFAGVMAFHSPGVVEETTVRDGRDAIYAYRSPSIAIRDNEIQNPVLGVHIMHTDDTLIADNAIAQASDAALFIMTGPERNAIVGNTLTDSATGADIGGTDSYVADNRLENNDLGLRVGATGSIVEHNVIAGNRLGADDRAMLPTNRVIANDFIANDNHAAAVSGPLRVWTHDGVGNYWEGATTLADGDPPSRSYTPTDPVDTRMHTTDGVPTLARAPAIDALGGFAESVPGMQTGSIVDLAPACDPYNPELLDHGEWENQPHSCTGI